MNRVKHSISLVVGIVGLTGLLGCDVAGLLPVSDVAAANDAPAAKSLSEDTDCVSAADAESLADHVLRLINIERFDIGAVSVDDTLTAVAADYACTMIDDGFFGHGEANTEQGLAERVTRAGYDYEVVGENLAAGIRTAADIVDAWLDSPAHRDILLDPAFTHTGIAVRRGGEHGIYCVLILADPVVSKRGPSEAADVR